MTQLAQADADAKRPVPDYDGRGNVDAHPTRRWSWIPRVVLFPAYVVEEYALRRPLGWIISTAERDQWLDTAVDTFSFGPQHNYLLIPTVSYEFGFRPNAGLYFSGDNVLLIDNSVRAEVSTAGSHYLNATLLDRYAVTDKTTISTRFDVNRRSDMMFFGIGPDVTDATRARWGVQQIDMHTSLKQQRFGESWISLSAGARSVEYRPPDCCSNDPSIGDAVTRGYFPLPPGYAVPYTVMYEHADMQLDSRPPKPAPGTGVYLRLHERGDFELNGQRGWVEYGGALGGAFDVTGHQRVLRLIGALDFVDPIAGETPFNELASLGSEMMPGFVTGWMRGRSTIAGQLAYTWPVGSWVDGVARVSVGNAFGERLEGFSIAKLRASGDLGITTNELRDQGVELVFGLGTETFEQGAGITSVRIAFGTRGGF
ncbi:MAG TPA: hypothetical protein VL463_35260 [Kofleriaceae bacterium]|nr:hypothetical protein [Kofleriaceae bacterium]